MALRAWRSRRSDSSVAWLTSPLPQPTAGAAAASTISGSSDPFEHDHRDAPRGLALVVPESRHQFRVLVEETPPLGLPLRDDRPRAEALRARLDGHPRMRAQVVVPAGVRRSSAFRRDDHVALPVARVRERAAIALGIRACLAGHRVAFATASDWVARLLDAQRLARLSEELRRLGRVPLVVVDEVGYVPFDPQAANLMFHLISNRYERASLVMTSNKPFSAWGEVFGDDVVATAMIDRLIHHAEILSLKGDSYRLRGKELSLSGGRVEPEERRGRS